MDRCLIREIKKEDNQALAAMIRKVFEEHDAPQTGTVYSDPTTSNLFKLFQEPKSKLWVAELDNKVVGCCGVYPTEGLEADTAELVKFYLYSSARGRGIGRKLMEQSIKSAVRLGYKKLYLESLPVFDKAVTMYEKLGFTKLSHPLGSSGHSSCNIWMYKHL